MDAGAHPAAFTTTHWSVVINAGRPDSPGVLDALEQLARTYQYPIYAEVRRQSHDHETARDLTQAFFERLLSGDFFSRADPLRGRFRNYLLTALNHFLADAGRYRTRHRRGGGETILSLDDDTLGERYNFEPAGGKTPLELYERRFAISLLNQVLRTLEEEFISFGNAELFQRLQPFLTGDDQNAPYYRDLGQALGLTEGAVKAAVYRLRKRYRELIREEIAQIVSSPEEVDEELQYLLRVLSS